MDEYKRLAGVYDPLLHPVMHRLRNKVTSVVVDLQPDKVIDICCGTGNQLKYLKRRGLKNAVGVDISHAMLGQAQKGTEKVACDYQDASSMSFEDDFFDVGIISFALHEKPPAIARQIISEAERIIHTGGHLIIADYMFDHQVHLPAKTAIHVVERIAGRDHYRHFREYLKYGGIDHLMGDYTLEQEYRFHGNATGIRVYRLDRYGQYA